MMVAGQWHSVIGWRHGCSARFVDDVSPASFGDAGMSVVATRRLVSDGGAAAMVRTQAQSGAVASMINVRCCRHAGTHSGGRARDTRLPDGMGRGSDAWLNG